MITTVADIGLGAMGLQMFALLSERLEVRGFDIDVARTVLPLRRV